MNSHALLSDDLGYLSTLIFSLSSIGLGAYFGVVGNKIINDKNKTNLIIVFYSMAGLLLLIPILWIVISLIESHSWSNLDWILVIFSSASGGLLFWSTSKDLHIKNVYRTDELSSMINDATKSADREQIKLFGGDLNFLGDSLNDMDDNDQYKALKQRKFKSILILCEEPQDAVTKRRYGKIIHEVPATLKFYEPGKADLSIRGRIYKISGVTHLLMFSKLRSKLYKAIDIDTADRDGALYTGIWDLTWSLGKDPGKDNLNDYENLFLADQ